jgi:hypothetical protein
MGLIKIPPAFAKNESVKVQYNNSHTSTEIPDFAPSSNIGPVDDFEMMRKVDEETRAWCLESAAMVKTWAGSPCEKASVHLRGPLGNAFAHLRQYFKVAKRTWHGRSEAKAQRSLP